MTTSPFAGGLRYVSPLRYVGGKARMSAWLSLLFNQQTSRMLTIEVWIEPFAGGAGCGLTMLAAARAGHPDAAGVDSLFLIERNPALAAFWRVCTHPDAALDLAARVEATTPTLFSWETAREVVADAITSDRHAGVSALWEGLVAEGDMDVAWAALLLNRCSRSGMVHPRVGPMGGRRNPDPTALLVRWNPDGVAQRIRHVAALGDSIIVHQCDAIDYLEELPESRMR